MDGKAKELKCHYKHLASRMLMASEKTIQYKMAAFRFADVSEKEITDN